TPRVRRATGRTPGEVTGEDRAPASSRTAAYRSASSPDSGYAQHVRILVGTEDGLHRLGADGSSPVAELAGRPVTALAPGPDYAHTWAIVDGAEVWRGSSEGRWKSVATLPTGIRANCIVDTAPGILIGTSEARLFRLEDGSLRSIDGFDQVDGREKWYTPWGGPPDARSISEDSNTIYVNVHVGGIV